MSFWVEILSGGGLGALFGGVQRIVETRMSNAFKLAEFEHIEKMQNLQFDHELRLSAQELLVEEIKQAGETLIATYDHDKSFKPATWVDNIRALVRPILTFTLVFMAWVNPAEFLTLASAVVLWWFASRVQLPRSDP